MQLTLLLCSLLPAFSEPSGGQSARLTYYEALADPVARQVVLQFPNPETTYRRWALWLFGGRQEWYDAQIAYAHTGGDAWRWRKVREEEEWLHHLYDLLDDVYFKPFPPERRQESVDELRRILGDEGFFWGWMPPGTPEWAFRR